MKRKRLLAIILAAMLLTASAPLAAAAGEVRVTLPAFPVTLNGQSVGGAEEEYPFLVYKDITYLPLTYYGCRLMGLYAAWSRETGLVITDIGVSGAYVATPRTSQNTGRLTAKRSEGKLILCGEEIDNAREEYPFLSFRDVCYMPMTWKNMHDRLGCSYRFSQAEGLVISRAQGPGSAVYLPLARRDDATSVTAAMGYFWYQDREGWIARTPMTGGPSEKLLELPANYMVDENKPVDASLYAANGAAYARWHTGGATMGSDHVVKFHRDGSFERVLDRYGTVAEDGMTRVRADGFVPPDPDNLDISYDAGETWEKAGSGEWIYGWAVELRETGGQTARWTDSLALRDGMIYVLGFAAWEPGRSAVCRVDPATGGTVVLTGEATGFILGPDALWYTDWDGAVHRCGLDGAGDEIVYPASQGVRLLTVEAGVTTYVDGQGCYHVVTGEGDAVYPVLRRSQQDGDTTIALFEDDGTGNGVRLAVFRDGKPIYTLRGVDLLAAGVSGGKLYYVLK